MVHCKHTSRVEIRISVSHPKFGISRREIVQFLSVTWSLTLLRISVWDGKFTWYLSLRGTAREHRLWESVRDHVTRDRFFCVIHRTFQRRERKKALSRAIFALSAHNFIARIKSKKRSLKPDLSQVGTKKSLMGVRLHSLLYFYTNP